jgi:DNA-3-methyladenine glycosylase I
VGLAKALKAAGFVFIGPTTAYALMQSCGLVDDHLVDCWVRSSATAGPTAT